MSKENENMNLEQVSGGTVGEFDVILQWLANNDHFVEASGMFFGHVPGANNGIASYVRHQGRHQPRVRIEDLV